MREIDDRNTFRQIWWHFSRNVLSDLTLPGKKTCVKVGGERKEKKRKKGGRKEGGTNEERFKSGVASTHFIEVSIDRRFNADMVLLKEGFFPVDLERRGRVA